MENKVPQRKQIRLKEYDYSKKGYYFITICTKNREEILSKIVNGSVKTDPYIILTKEGKIIEKELLNIENHLNNIKIDKYIIMPNHIHVIIKVVGAGLDQPGIKISNLIGLYKGGVTRKLSKSIWQRNYYEYIIRNEKEYYKIIEYMKYNPIKWLNEKNEI